MARKTVEGLLELAKKAAKGLGMDVHDDAYKWWKAHYVHSFFFALTFKEKKKEDLEDEKNMAVLAALAFVLGRTAAAAAADDGKTVIAAARAARASQIVDCPALSAEDIGRMGIRADWCNE